MEVYKASAGSGKTYQLAYKYICLLLGEPDGNGGMRLYRPGERKGHREILAITFTNKATDEMKQRIIKELALLGDVKAKSNYRKGLVALFAATDQRIAQAARAALTSMLYDYGKIQVSTIDSFFQRVLRTFAYEADLTSNYELLIESQEILNTAIAEMLIQICGVKARSKLDKDRIRRIRSWIQTIVAERYSNKNDIRLFDKNSGIRSSLVKFTQELSNESYQSKAKEINKFFDVAPDVIEQLIAALTAEADALKLSIMGVASSIAAHPNANNLNGGKIKWLSGLINGNVGIPKGVIGTIVTGDATPNSLFKTKVPADPSICAMIDNLAELLRRHATIAFMMARMHYMGLFHEMVTVARNIQVHLNSILLSDTNTILNEIIAGSDTPFIYERLGQQLHHFLIDEFQDTSQLQWHNLRPLLANSIGSGFDNMIIGDVKQCIYRFRNSYPELLDTELQKDGSINYAITLPQINTNWRSSKDVIDFNNELFMSIGRHYDINPYKTAKQNYAPTAADGYIDVVSTTDYDTDTIARMAEHMRRQLDSGYEPADIVVLVRNNPEKPVIMQALMALTGPGEVLEGVEIVSNESLLVGSAHSVQYIITQLRELDRIQGTPQASLSRSGLPPKAGDRELDWLQNTLREIKANQADCADPLEEVLRRFDELNHRTDLSAEEDAAWRKRMRGRSVYEVVEELIAKLPVKEWRSTEVQYLTAFQDLVEEYCRRGAPSVHGFLKKWDENLNGVATIGVAEGANAIRVMTIHKSKGLEFECVHLPLTDKALDKDTNYRWYDASQAFKALNLGCATPDYFPLHSVKDLAMTMFADEYKQLNQASLIDEINVLYVAMTRAKRELIVTIKESDKEYSHSAIIGSSLTYPKTDTPNGWQCTVGAPTRKIDEEEEDSGVEPMHITSYKVYDRQDFWANIKVPKEKDDNLP